jgi:hypothetical protein
MASDETGSVDGFNKALAELEASQKTARKHAALQRAYKALGYTPAYTVEDSELTAMLKLMGEAVERPDPRNVPPMERQAAREARRAAFELYRQFCGLVMAVKGRRIDPAHDHRKRAGGRASGRKRKTAAQERQAKVVMWWRKLELGGKPVRERVGIIAAKVGCSNSSVRRDLQAAGIKR